jgi:putative oxidoreductase
MNLQALYRRLDVASKLADLFQSPFALAARIYVSWVFLKSGYLKVSDWDQTLSLFEFEYHVPLLSPFWGAVSGAAGELVFSALLIMGLGGRLPAIGLFAVNILAVISYQQVLLADAGIVGLGQHQLWGFILLMLIVYGPGNWSLDRLLSRKKQTTLH